MKQKVILWKWERFFSGECCLYTDETWTEDDVLSHIDTKEMKKDSLSKKTLKVNKNKAMRLLADYGPRE